ncbi:MAG: hypothetical protein R3C10_23855 [Pirellulales bacterium]
MATVEKVKPNDLPDSLQKRRSVAKIIAASHEPHETERLAAEFERHDHIIRDGLKQFLDLGKSLLTIRNRELDVFPGFVTFEQYVPALQEIMLVPTVQWGDAVLFLDFESIAAKSDGRTEGVGGIKHV